MPPLERHAHSLRALLFVVAVSAGSAIFAGGATSARHAALTLPDLIAPLAPGSVVAEGYVLSAPYRGEEHDVVFQARRTREGVTTVVELHILDRGRWTGIRDTAHYGVAWEVARSTASWEESEAAAEHLAQVVRNNEVSPGVAVDAVPLRRGASVPPAATLLQRVTGPRGACLVMLLVLATWALSTLPHGAALVSLFLFGLGLTLRLPHLDVPFVRDQDVQRVFTSHASFVEIFTGVGLRDRHPPLYFAVLHLAQHFGQSELVVRMPAAVVGALMGPVMVAAAATLRKRVELAALLALVPTLSFAFVAYSREVSPLPLHALLLVLVATSVVKHHETGARVWAVTTVLSVAVSLLLYYAAILPTIALLLLLSLFRSARSSTAPVVLLGCLVGAPSFVLAGMTFARDGEARAAANQHPIVAWGEREVLGTARAVLEVTSSALGPAVLVLVLVATVVAVRRRDLPSLVPLVGFVATLVGLAALTPVARVQPYYVMGALPLLLLAVVAASPTARPTAPTAATLAVAAAVALTLLTKVSPVATLYVPDERATMPAFVDAMLQRAERRVLTVAHYDMTLLAYYIGRARGVEVDASMLERRGAAFSLRGTGFEIFPLVATHTLDEALEPRALAALEAIVADGPCLVIDRPMLGLDQVRARLARCQLIADGPDSALYRCATDDPPAR